MFKLKKNLLNIFLLFCLLCINIQGAYSYAADIYNGRVKNGSYHCIKDGATCDFERQEGGSLSWGSACPQYNKNLSQEENNKIMADFLNSKYCKYNQSATKNTSSVIKKYNCNYDDGYATVFRQGEKVIVVNNPNNLKRAKLEDFYEPDKCTEGKLESDSYKPNATVNTVNSGSDYTPNNNNNVPPNDTSYQKKQAELIKNTIGKSVQEETDILNKEITSLKEENQKLKKEITALKDKINIMEQYIYYLVIFLAITFVLTLAAFFKSNNNPYHRL